MLQDGEAALAEQGKGKVARPEPDGISLALTRCPTEELLAFSVGDGGQDANAHEESWSWGATALPENGGELALLEVTSPARPRPSPPRRLRSEAYWEQKAAVAARWPARSPWELGVRARRPCLDEGGSGLAGSREGHRFGPAAPAAPAAGRAEGDGAIGSPGSRAGAISRALRREARGPPAPPGSPSAALGAAPSSRG
ncbi:unnamed protein product [Prorocentrum cordatum]|uniref:Uncharacterized protein n=1 Tax=Prorocentrum cordatum TaxID=2364126 RepID=A0ABN9SMH7_9DINO|nr:unnamed protein product [Polarella glacialis]